MVKEWDKEEGGFAGVARKLGQSDQYILDRATAQFQKHKEAFPLLMVEEEIYVRGKNNDYEGKAIPLNRYVSKPGLTLLHF